MDGSSFLASFKAAAASSKDMIQFSGAIDSFPIKGDEVVVVPSSGDHDMGSSKLQISNIVNFGWEFSYYHGQLVAAHKSGSYFAYGIVSPGKNTGMVRVVQKKTDQRVLIKGMKGKVKDLAFARCMDQIILGIVDEFGNLFIIKIQESSPLTYEILLQINSTKQKNEGHRLLWCPYLPEDEDASTEDASSARLLVLTHGNVAEMWNIDMVLSEHGAGSILNNSEVKQGKLAVADHGGAIRDASFSPDGTALATASDDGQVKFFQVYFHGGENPRCLHHWKPHEGRPVSSLFFLDNHRDHNPDEQFWKFALTGACQNSELKLWSCENWTCIQTLNIADPNDGKPIEFKAELDISASYLLLSDIHRKNVYALQLQICNDKVKFVSVSEFATPSPFLSMAMLEAGVRKVADKHTLGEDDDDSDDDNVEDPQATSREATVINFLLVQPKSLQECRIVYDDAFSQQPHLDLEAAIDIKKEPEEDQELAKAADKITLMSPEVFSSSKIQIKEEPATPTDVATPKRGNVMSNMLTASAAIASGASSPSREVQDILGDSEEQGGLGAEIVITEEDEEEDDEESEEILVNESDEDSDELSKMLDQAHSKIKKEAEIKSEPLSPSPQQSQCWKPTLIKEEKMIKKEPISSPILASSNQNNDQNMQVIMARLADMSALIQTQRAEVALWREEMRTLRREDLNNFKSVLDDSTSEATTEMKSSTQMVLNSIKSNVKATLCEEVRKATPLLVQAASASLNESLQKEVHSKVLKADLHMKEAMNKLVISKSDAMASNLASHLAPAIQAGFKDAMVSTLIPAFERSMQNLFAQLATTFNKGLKDYEGQLKTHSNKQLEPLFKEMKDLKKANYNDLEKKLANMIRTEMRSLSVTPSISSPAAPGGTPNSSHGPQTMAEIQTKIKLLLNEGRLNDAFAIALSASNLCVVVELCEMVNSKKIFEQKTCPLTQAVLLSLIQQLGHSLESNTELKLSYLHEAVLALDQDDPATRAHIYPLMGSLRNQLTNFAHANPEKREVKTLLMMIQGMTTSSTP